MHDRELFSYAPRQRFLTPMIRRAIGAPSRASWLRSLSEDMTWRGLRWIAVAASTLTLSACQVFQPYVIPEHFQGSDAPTNTFCPASISKNDDEIAYARGIQRQLSCFARQHAEFASAAGYTLIPLAALVAYQGFKQANPHNIAALSGAGFAAYGIFNYQYKPRDVIYLAGVSAVDCAIQIASPSILSKTQTDALKENYNSFSANVTQIFASILSATDSLSQASGELVEARQARAQLTAKVATSPAGKALDSALDALASELKSDQDALASARDATISSPKRYAMVVATDAQVRKDLASTAESIVHSVNQQIATMTPDPTSLASTLSSLKLPSATPASAATEKSADGSDSSKKVSLVAEFAKPGNGSSTTTFRAIAKPAPADHIADALHHMQVAQIALAKAENQTANASSLLSPLTGELDSITTPNNLEKVYKECSIDVKTKVALSIAVPKDGITVQSGGQAVDIPITGGSGKYNPVVTNPPAKGTLSIDVKQGSGNSSVLSFSAKNFDKDVDLSVLVQDDAGTAAPTLSVKVKHEQ